MGNKELKKMDYGIFEFLIPDKKREEVLGDLSETEQKMKDKGYSKQKIRFVLFWHKCFIAISLLRLRITDYGKARKEIDKNN